MKFYNIVFFLHLYVITTCSSTPSELLIEKAAEFANSVFSEFLTAVAWWHDKTDGVAEFIKQFRGCIVLTPMQDGDNEIIREFNKNKSFIQTVFIATETQELEDFMTLLYQDLVVPIRLIVVLRKLATNVELSKLLKTAWDSDVVDILVVSYNADDSNDVSLITYFPYSIEKCGNFTPVHLNHDTLELFPKKFTSFHGCEIRTTLLEMSPYSRLNLNNSTLVSISGIDGNVLNMLFEILNASMYVVTVNDLGGIGVIVNGTATGSLVDLVSKQADILLPALIMSHSRYPYTQFSHSFEAVHILWFGPRRRKIDEWLRILQPFMSDITPALFSSAIVFVVVTMIVQRIGLHKSFSKDSVLFQSFMVFLGIEVNFKTKSWLTNSLFMLWIWFCMVVRIAFQGDLVNGLENTILETPLRRFETAVKQVDGYGGIEGLRDYFIGTEYYNGYDVIQFSNVTHYLKAIGAGKRYLLVTDMLLGLDSAPNIQVLYNDPVTQTPASFYIRPGWPAAPEFNNLLLRMIEAGFVQKVLKLHFWEWAKEVDSNDDREARPLTLETLIGCFYGLGVLYAICTIVWFVEIIYYTMKHDHDHQKTSAIMKRTYLSRTMNSVEEPNSLFLSISAK